MDFIRASILKNVADAEAFAVRKQRDAAKYRALLVHYDALESGAPAEPADDLLDLKEVAARRRSSIETARKWVKRNNLAVMCSDGRLRVPKSRLIATSRRPLKA